MTDPDITFLARFAYEQGTDPIDYAVHGVIESYIDAFLVMRAARVQNPGAYPGYLVELSVPALSRQILGQLMDAGWMPPEVTP